MQKFYDVIIVGAGPAGLSCSITLVKNKKTCLVLEYGADVNGTICGDGLSVHSITLLGKLGIDIEKLGGKKEKKKKEYFNGSVRTVKFSDVFCLDFELGVSRDALNNSLLNYAISCGVPISLNTPCHSISRQKDNTFLVNDTFIANRVVLACGVPSGKRFGLSYPVDLPFGISSRIIGSCPLDDNSFHYFYSDALGNGYAWVFPVDDNTWNVGVWSQNKCKNLAKTYSQLEKNYFGSANIIYERKPKGRIIGAGNGTKIDTKGYICIGDCNLDASISSGEGVSYALESGIQAALLLVNGNQIPEA